MTFKVASLPCSCGLITPPGRAWTPTIRGQPNLRARTGSWPTTSMISMPPSPMFGWTSSVWRSMQVRHSCRLPRLWLRFGGVAILRSMKSAARLMRIR